VPERPMGDERGDRQHRDHQQAGADGQAPVVVAETDAGLVLLLTPTDLEACGGSTDRLVEAIDQAVTSKGLTWPAPLGIE